MLKKLRIKFVCITMAFVSVMLCVILGMVVHFTGQSMERQSLRMIQMMVSGQGRPELHPDEIRMPFVSITVDRNGKIQVNEIQGELTAEDEILRIAEMALKTREQTGILEEYSLRFWKNPGPGGERIVFLDISYEREMMHSLIRTCVLIGGMSFALCLLLSMGLANWAIKPVELAWQQQKQFVADASHELKTPLTVIMTNAEMLQGEEYSETEQQQFSGNILTMSRQMRGLVEGLLELARVDNGAVKTDFIQVDMSALVSDGMLPFEPLFFEKALGLESRVEPGIRLKGSIRHLQQVLDILLDNAMKYSTPGGVVRLSLQRQGMHCLLRVASPGAALSRQEQKAVFERFYRVDKARSRNGSYGLGLSIAKSIVEEHRGRIWAESENGQNTFCVQLPLN